MKKISKRNPVAKFAGIVNRAVVIPDKKKRYTRLKNLNLLQGD